MVRWAFDQRPIFVRAKADSINMGIQPDANTDHNVYVDDTLIADLEPRLDQAIVGSIEACFIIFGPRCDDIRPCPISLKKFVQTAIATSRVQLGLLVDTHSLTIGLPQEKLAKLQNMVKGLHDHRAQILIREGAEFLGLLFSLNKCS